MTCNGIWQIQVFLIKKRYTLIQISIKYCNFLCRNRQRIELQNIWNKTLIMDFNRIIKKLIFSFEKIENLCDDLFCTGNIVNNDQCIKPFEQFLNNKPFDFFDLGEINEMMDLIHMELMTLKKVLETLIMIFQFFIIKKIKTRTNIIIKENSKLFSKTEFIRDFKQQLKKW